jgi:hypothetical protein
MTDNEFNTFIKEQDFITSDFFEEAHKFWFETNGKIRTPFPLEIHEKLQNRAFRVFMGWVYELNDNEIATLENEAIAETYEMILFNQAMEMVDNEEQRITISYPFLPRPGDPVDDNEKGASIVINREVLVKNDEKKYLKLILENKTKTRWETEFELPV